MTTKTRPAADPLRLTLNGRAREIEPGTDLPALLAELGIEPRAVIVEHNGRILRPGDFEGVPLSAGDRVEIVHFVGGG
jgi:thiamine biosynthesis protein ThiS